MRDLCKEFIAVSRLELALDVYESFGGLKCFDVLKKLQPHLPWYYLWLHIREDPSQYIFLYRFPWRFRFVEYWQVDISSFHVWHSWEYLKCKIYIVIVVELANLTNINISSELAGWSWWNPQSPPASWSQVSVASFACGEFLRLGFPSVWALLQ